MDRGTITHCDFTESREQASSKPQTKALELQLRKMVCGSVYKFSTNLSPTHSSQIFKCRKEKPSLTFNHFNC